MHAFLHKCLWEEHQHPEDKLAWLALSGQIGKDEIQRQTSILGGKAAKYTWTEERREEQKHRISSLHESGRIPSPKGRVIQGTGGVRWNGPVGCKWIHNPITQETKQVSTTELDSYLMSSWKLGRLNSNSGRPANGTSRVALWRHRKKQLQMQQER